MAHKDQVQRAMFGGFNKGAAFFGWLVATAAAALLVALIGAAGGAVALTGGLQGVVDEMPAAVGVASAVALGAALALAYYAGGYVAGRMARFDGGRQGVGVWATGLVVALVLAVAGLVFGSQYNLLQQLNLPSIPMSLSELTAGGLVTLLVTLGVTLVAAMAGGKMGQRYHTRIDRAGEAAAAAVAQELKQGGASYTRRDALPTFGERIETRADRRRDRDR